LYLTPYFRFFSHSWLITGFVTRLTRRVSLVKQELLPLPEHLSSSPIFSGVGVAPYLVFCVFFVNRCLSFCPFSLGHCVVYSSSIYGFWLPLWCLRTLPTDIINKKKQQQNTKQTHNVRTIPKYYKWRKNRYPEHAYR
jgi:protein-S-isoprenylcysteine O-methyltransferase Ste14